MRLIDADALKEKINTTFWSETGAIIDNAPTIDAVEVVRCRDCKYGEKRIEDYRCWMFHDDWDIGFSPKHFCSYGRRREDGEE